MAFDLAVAAITFTGSALSCMATTLVLGCFVIWRHNQTSFRHLLVLNLTIADFVNSTVNVVSGAIYIRDRQLSDGAACTFNGWIAQFSVQATDFSILAISVATLLVVKQRARLVHLSTTASIAICLSVWILPLVTSTTAAAMGALHPVSGNWCWITRDRTDLRYALTHGWRFAIIAITVFIYAYIWWYLSKHFKSMQRFDITMESTDQDAPSVKQSDHYAQFDKEIELEDKPPPESLDMPRLDSKSLVDHAEAHDYTFEQRHMSHNKEVRLERSDSFSECVKLAYTYSAECTKPGNAEPGFHSSTPTQKPAPTHSHKRYREIKRMLLLNGYPLLYVILWIPGIVNRIMEGLGSQNSRVQNILQCSTQFVGFANAITYGLNQQWRAGR